MALSPSTDHAVGGDAVAGAHEDDRTDRQAFGRNLAGLAVLLEQRGLRNQRRQRLDAGARLAGGDAFQQLADEEEEDDGRRLFAGIDDDGADGRDRHQHLDGERRAGHRRHDGAPRDRHEPDQHGDDEGIGRDRRYEMADGIGKRPAPRPT